MSSGLARLRAALTALGVVLAIAIVVFLLFAILGMSVGYVWGTIFTGGGDPATDPPEIEFETTLEDGSLVVTHDGGDTVDPADLELEIDGDDRGTWAQHGGSGTVAEGESITIDGVAAGDEFTIRWESGGESFVLHQETV